MVTHYAGPVEYETAQWIEKNNCRLSTELETEIGASTNDVVKTLSLCDTSKVKSLTVGKAYIDNLQELISTLRESQVHYIRCFKPNQEKKPDLIEDAVLKEQLVQSGTIDLIKLMHEGFPNRIPFK